MSTAPATWAGTDSNSAKLQPPELAPPIRIRTQAGYQRLARHRTFFQVLQQESFHGSSEIGCPTPTRCVIVLLMKIRLKPGRHVALMLIQNRRNRGFGFGEQRTGPAGGI